RGWGRRTAILVQEGETVEVGTKLGQIGGAAGSPAPQAEALPEPATQAAAQQADAASSAETPQPTQAQEPAQAAYSNGNRFVSPVVARIASEHNVDPAQVSGTGRGGRVTKQDIMKYIESGAAAPPQPAAPPAPPAAPAPPREPAQAAPVPPKSPTAAPPTPQPQPG